MYRSPDSEFSESLQILELILQSVKLVKKDLIICGDFNINYMVNSKQKNDLESLFLMFNCISFVNEPTRVTSQSKTMLDNVFSNSAPNYLKVRVEDLGISDHKGIIVQPLTSESNSTHNNTTYRQDINKHTV